MINIRIIARSITLVSLLVGTIYSANAHVRLVEDFEVDVHDQYRGYDCTRLVSEYHRLYPYEGTETIARRNVLGDLIYEHRCEAVEPLWPDPVVREDYIVYRDHFRHDRVIYEHGRRR